MTAVEHAEFRLIDADGKKLGQIIISLLPSMREAHGLSALLDCRNAAAHDDDDIEPVQLLEGCEYLYEVTGHTEVSIDKCELFIADDKSGTRGRLCTRLSTGRVEVNITADGNMTRPFAIEVRSTKLNYLNDYRRMLASIAELGAELLLERFAPSEQRLTIDTNIDADSIYQRFVFLRGLLQGERLSAALRRVITTPYVQWERIDEGISPGRGLRGNSSLAYELMRAGPRMEWPTCPHPGLTTVPLRMHAHRTEETLDNVPNRFVLFALEEWRGLITSLLDILERECRAAPKKLSAPVARGLREGAALADYLENFIRAPIFKDVGRLSEFPLANQALQKKEGYRDILHAYLLVQLGASLTWAGGDDVFGAGQRNVAALYEYWVFLELAKIVSGLCDEQLDLQTLVTESTTGLNLILRREHAHAVRGGFRRKGRNFQVELSFNQQFTPDLHGTWTKSLRPDCSLHIIPLEPERNVDDIWLHFDAKYRVNRIEDLLGGDDEAVLAAKVEDFYKMHTYRDAILRAVGAYILFPGTQKLTYEQFNEVLPGLGAFPLRPSGSDYAEGSAAIREFLQNVFDHVATQTTQHERARYWQRESTKGSSDGDGVEAVSFLHVPPADAKVLLGYVKSAAHHEWIEQHGLYNLRAESSRRGSVGLRGAELSSQIVVLHGELGAAATLYLVIDEPQLLTAAELLALGYPDPKGHIYFCMKLKHIANPPAWCSPQRVRTLVQKNWHGRLTSAPVVVSWHDLATAEK